jgi:transposase
MEPHLPSPHDWSEWRRLRALELKYQGWKQRDIAAALGVSEGAVSQWLSAARRGGADALTGRTGRRGSTPKLPADRLRLVPEFLWHGPEAYGLIGPNWTCNRVARVIREEFGVSYSDSQVSRLIKKLGWTPQTPVTKVSQRDEAAIERWRRERWPALKEEARGEGRTLVFVDESPFYPPSGLSKIRGSTLKTSDENGWHTPDLLSALGGLTLEGEVHSLVRPTLLDGSHVVAFLGQFLGRANERLLLIWDGSPIHRRPDVKAFLAGDIGRTIHVELLPPFAPDLNPMGWLWRHLRDMEMRGLACSNLEELHMELHLALGRIRRKPRLVHSFFEKAGLGI